MTCGAPTQDAGRLPGTKRSVNPGKRADILILNDDPLQDLQDVGPIYAVIRDGVVMFESQILQGVQHTAGDVLQASFENLDHEVGGGR